jgi:hypothetical protein
MNHRREIFERINDYRKGSKKVFHYLNQGSLRENQKNFKIILELSDNFL